MTLKTLGTYGRPFQLKVLGSLLTDKKFLLNVREMLSPEYFDSDSHKWIIVEISKYWDTYHNCISMDTLKIELQKVENEVLRVAVKEELRNSYSASEEDLAYVEEEFNAFLKNQSMKAAILDSAELLKDGDFDGIRNRVEKALKAGMDKNLGHEYKKDIESRYQATSRQAIPFPWPLLNENTQGGLGPGDLAIVFGSPGGGKSWLSISYAAYAVSLGYRVNYYTLELSEEYVGKRFDCNLSGYGIDQIGEHRAEIDALVAGLPGELIVKEYAPKAASINTLRSHIQKCTDMGHKPDLVIIDYIDYLKPSSKSKYSERKDEVDDMYIAAKGLAKELKIPIISPSQVNRMGAKDDVIEGDKAAGSYDKMMVADMALSLSRKKEDKILGIGRVHIMKNRYGPDGITYNIKLDTNNGRMEIEGSHTEEVGEGTPKMSFSKQALEKFFSGELQN